MPLNPAATEFKPHPKTPEAQSADKLSKSQSNHQLKYQIYKAKRYAVIHDTLCDAYNSAHLNASTDPHVHDDNVRDKLIVDFVRLLAGVGWSTSTVLRAAVLLEMEPSMDATEALRRAKGLREEFHRGRVEGVEGEVRREDGE